MIEENKVIFPCIPLRGVSIFPNTVIHFDVGREKSIHALEKAMADDKLLFVSTQKDDNVLIPTFDDIYTLGTIVRIKQMLKIQGDAVRVLVEGVCRAQLIQPLEEEDFMSCTVKQIAEELDLQQMSPEDKAAMKILTEAFIEYAALTGQVSDDLVDKAISSENPIVVADKIANELLIRTSRKQKVLETMDFSERIRVLTTIIAEENEIAVIEKELSKKVKENIDHNQKEYFLREKMKAIQEELGVNEDAGLEAADWLKELEELHLSEKVEEKIKKEINKFSKMMPSSAEATVIRNYVETILALPWNKASKVNVNLKKAEKILNEDHYGLDKVKERVLEYLAVIHLSKAIKGPILCLVGPPGVGKTSIARSIAKASGREFVRMSLGGVRDEAEIRGHRRTYIGAIPGRVISCLKDAGTNNPVFLFDEVDKIGADFKGDPASALLEVLDPEQNNTFTDHFLEVPFDLSKVMFITTANSTDTIPRPLLDRMEIVEVPGYTEEEKVKIAQRYLIPKKVKEHGLKKDNIKISEKAVHDLINYYTRESGVRNLEREVANLCRKVARKIVSAKAKSYSITPSNLEKYLGKHRFHFDMVEGENQVGVTTGLAWTAVGGDTLQIETTAVAGSGKLVLTGQLGDVMQESAKAGISYIRSVADELGIEEDFYKKYDLHVHVPEGAVPKDGPSAGVTMCTAVISTLTGIPVRRDVAMTGEVTLRGKVLPVGGIREKVLAAHRAGIKKVLLPKDNAPDIDEIPNTVRRKMEFVLIDHVSSALSEALVK
ncbi:endopeptidase La [Anaerotruncus sp. 80]|uniref:Lon protease n=1 Tax=Anaerotruncus colihominis TaxID=169435 RepID=A0A845QKT0_9FIRM|nr:MULTISPECIES: endopeptidase La [Anaerotruncus]NBH62469.1 endopeptidase La [Anaerotruncus colihominis]NCF03124.1 endopeptidase La [Anaerotruncus sp. 80]